MLSPVPARLRIVRVSAAWPDAEPERAHAAFERRDALLEDARRRIHDPGVDVAEFLEPEETRRVSRVVEDVARRGIDRHGPRVGRRIGLLPGVQRQRLGVERGRLGLVAVRAVLVVRHLVPPMLIRPCYGRSIGGGFRPVSPCHWVGPRWGLCFRRLPVAMIGGKQKPQFPSWNCGPGTDPRSRHPLVRCATSDPILRTAGPPAHTHVP